MFASIIASAAILVTAVNAAGSAIVVNQCSYPVYVYNTPASGGGYSEIDNVLSTGGSYTQSWTELTNGAGWSIKLAPDTTMSNIMQYEYTFHNDGIIWYDLSDVNGNPWNGDWEITADGSCTPKQQAYRYATDDAYGMQSCPDSSTITVTLCSGSGAAPAAASAAAPASSQAYTSTAAAPSSSYPVAGNGPAPQKNYAGQVWSLYGDKVVAAAPTSTTMITKVANKGAATVTHVKTQHVTHYVTATAAPAKHHKHHRHAHNVAA